MHCFFTSCRKTVHLCKCEGAHWHFCSFLIFTVLHSRHAHSEHTHTSISKNTHTVKDWDTCAVDEETEKERVHNTKGGVKGGINRKVCRESTTVKHKRIWGLNLRPNESQSRQPIKFEWNAVKLGFIMILSGGIINQNFCLFNCGGNEVWNCQSWDETQGYNNSIYESILFVYYGSGCASSALCFFGCVCALVLLSLSGPIWVLGVRTFWLDLISLKGCLTVKIELCCISWEHESSFCPWRLWSFFSS